MQNYQNFIDELFRLNIDTIQYFVKDEQVLYPHNGWWLPKDLSAEQLAETPVDRLPGYVSTFMSLDRYDQNQTENRYEDNLKELRRRAVTDLLLLEPIQVKRILVNVKSENERLKQLLKNAHEYQNAWQYGKLDLLSDCFLELQLLEGFFIKSRPADASPHGRFAHHLTDAIMYKQGILSGFIKQIESALQSTLLVSHDIVPPPTAIPDTPDKGRPSKKVAARPFANFIDKLQNGYTEEKLNALLVHMLIKNREGKTLDFKKYLLHPVIDALISEGYFEHGNREKDQKALSKFLGLSETRIKNGWGEDESAARLKATTYLQKERKKNGSNLVP